LRERFPHRGIGRKDFEVVFARHFLGPVAGQLFRKWAEVKERMIEGSCLPQPSNIYLAYQTRWFFENSRALALGHA
jgi:hypothetical protein